MKRLLAFLVATLVSQVHAETCESVVALSKLVSSMVQDKESVEGHAAKFCSEYSKRSSSGGSINVGASYKFLSLNMGSSSASEDEVASKYCSASSNYSQSRDAYKQYIETISPGAYGAYERCLQLNKEMRFNLNTSSVLPTEFSMSVGFISSVSSSSEAKVAYTASEGVSCKWNDSTRQNISISTGSTAILSCKRSSQTRRSFVNIVRTDIGNQEPLTLPWQAYDAQGNPIDTLISMQDRLKNLESSLNYSQVNSIVGFLSDKCPSGWTIIPEAQGRFLRGIDANGSNANDPDGKRLPGSIQGDTLKKHVHVYQTGFHDGQSNSGTGYDPNKKSPVAAQTGEGTYSGGEPLGSETRPKNIAVLFCSKR